MEEGQSIVAETATEQKITCDKFDKMRGEQKSRMQSKIQEKRWGYYTVYGADDVCNIGLPLHLA